MLGVNKPNESDMGKFNSCGDQVTHFVDWMKNPNVEKKGEYHIWKMTNYIYIYIYIIDKQRKNTSKVGCYNIKESVKIY